MNSEQEREQFQLQHEEKMRERAKELGLKIEETE
jgi:hypothetical protein